MDLRGSGWAKNDPSKKSKLARLRTSRARATEPARDPNLPCGVQAGPLSARQPTAREKAHGRWRKA